MSERRVVVTGIGLVTPLGITVNDVWNNLINCKSGIKLINKFDTEMFQSKIGGIIEYDYEQGFNPNNAIPIKDLKKMDVFIQYGIDAAVQAINDSNWMPEDQHFKDRTGVILGSGIGGLKMIEDTSIELYKSNRGKVSPYFIPASLINLLSGHVSIKYGFSGPNHSVVTACSTSTHAIGDAFRIIKYGDADVMITGGAESPITPVGLAGFIAARTLSTKYNDNPEKASRPWDSDRDGFVISEGAAVVVLEEYNHAIKRGAKIYGEIVGYGLTGDGYHMTAPHPDGRGAYRAMENALKDANLSPNDIDYINAHGTSTPVGDPIELAAVERLFANHSTIKMSSTKSSMGHLLGAAGGVEFIVSLLAMQNQIVPATINLHNSIDTKIDLVPLEPKKAKVDYILSNSFGFGGTNASIIARRI